MNRRNKSVGEEALLNFSVGLHGFEQLKLYGYMGSGLQSFGYMGSGLQSFNLLFNTAPMARKPRVHYPGTLYHVILRGDAEQNIFFNLAIQVGDILVSRILQNLSFVIPVWPIGVRSGVVIFIRDAAKRLQLRAKGDVRLAERMRVLLRTLS